jgi:hypothetical protein
MLVAFVTPTFQVEMDHLCLRTRITSSRTVMHGLSMHDWCYYNHTPIMQNILHENNNQDNDNDDERLVFREHDPNVDHLPELLWWLRFESVWILKS